MNKFSSWMDIFGIRCEILKGFYNIDFKEKPGKYMWYSKNGLTYGIKLKFPTEHMDKFMDNVREQSKLSEIINVPSMYRSRDGNKLTNIEMNIIGLRKLGNDRRTAQFILKVDAGDLEYKDMSEQETTKYIRNENLRTLLEK